MIKTFCDVCGKELTRNMVSERLIVKSGDFRTEVYISKKGASNEGDLCLSCLLKMLNQKPKRKYQRKPKVEQVSPPVVGEPANPTTATLSDAIKQEQEKQDKVERERTANQKKGRENKGGKVQDTV